MRLPILRLRFFLLILAALLAIPLQAQDSSADRGSDPGTSVRQLDHSGPPQKDELTPQEREERLRDFKKEVGKAYQKWLNQDVRYIITPEEVRAFKLLGTDEERDAFIDQFWRRRDPTPDTAENEYREEYYRRIQYADEHFAAGVPGWRTDRGHIYVVWGPPDSIDSHPSGGAYQRSPTEGGGSTSTYPFEVWHYRHLNGIGDNIAIEFVDTCQCNDYQMTTDPNEKDALLHTPGGGPTTLEQFGLGDRAARITGMPSNVTPFGQSSTNQFDALEREAKLNGPPPLPTQELEERVDTRIRYNLLPFEMRADFVRLTPDTVLLPITLQIKTGDLTFVSSEGIQRAAADISGRISTLSGRIASTFQDTVGVDEPDELLAKAKNTEQMYWKAITLKPGLYKIQIVVKDVNGKRTGTLVRSMRVPEFDEGRLSSSSLILADLMERVPTKSIGSGRFILGDVKVRPRPQASDGSPAAFKRSQRLNVWLQIYNLQQDKQTHKPNAEITYDVVNLKTGKSCVHSQESSASYEVAEGQLTIEKSMALAPLAPGTYNLKITIADSVSKQTISPSARFLVE